MEILKAQGLFLDQSVFTSRGGCGGVLTKPVQLARSLLLVATFATAAVLNGPAISQPVRESRIALVIGNANYKNSPLTNPVNDARLIEAELNDSGFQVIKAENATIREMRRLVREFGDRLKASGGVGLFYFAGHGVQVHGENFLVSVDSDIRNEDEIADDSINAQVVLEKMQSAGNRMNLIVLDACRNNPFAVKSRSAVNGLATINAPSGSLVAYATAPGSVASDGNGANGLYTQHLVRAMRQPGLPVEEVFKQVRAAVRRDSKNQQTPWENTALEGQFYFKAPQQLAVAAPVISTPAPATPAPLPSSTSPAAQSSVEVALWESVKSSVSAPDLQLYVDRYPRGTFADLAKARIVALQAATSTRVPPTSEIVGQGTGRLFIKDEYTGVITTVDVYPIASTSEATNYSSGDTISSRGEVLAVRFGPYIGKVKSGSLWTLPLKSGASGSADMTFDGLHGAGQFTWRVVQRDERMARLDVQLRMPRVTPAASGSSWCQGAGLWEAQYRNDSPLPIASKLKVASVSCGINTVPDRIATEWQPKP